MLGNRTLRIVVIAVVIIILGIFVSFQVYKTNKTKREIQKTLQGEYWNKVATWYKAHPCNSNSKVFLGNSLTEGFDLSMFEDSNVVKRGISGDFTSGILLRLDEITDAKPAKIFIEIGINDIVEKVPLDEVEENYEQILQKISTHSPKTKIYIQSILPSALTYIRLTTNEDVNRRIDKMNERLQVLAIKYKATYIDIHSHLEENNALNKKFTEDGIHLSHEAYGIWRDVVKPYL